MTTTANGSGNLKGKVALVTGGSRGIGAAVVRRLVKDGAYVFFTTSKSVDAAEKLVGEVGSGNASYIVADNMDAGAVRKAVQAAAKKSGQLDILVNNAGVFESVGGDESVYRKQSAVNVDAVWVAVNEAVKVIPAGGRIVNVGSVAGEQAFPGFTEYSATKATVAMLTRGWARDFGPKGITVNCVEPGPIDTDMNPADSEMAKGLAPQVPLGRYGKPDEVAAAVAFMVSPEASYVNGARLLVDGGVGA